MRLIGFQHPPPFVENQSSSHQISIINIIATSIIIFFSHQTDHLTPISIIYTIITRRDTKVYSSTILNTTVLSCARAHLFIKTYDISINEIMAMMGWWKPYFFLDPSGVQLLVPALVIDGSIFSLILSAVGIAFLALIDRYTAHASRNANACSNTSDGLSQVYVSTVYYTIQRFTSGLLMLIMMSFNVILFLEVIIFSGIAELGMKIRNRRGGGEGIGNFRIIPSEIEMDGC